MFEEEQLLLFDDAPYFTPPPFAPAGSKRWIQVAVNRAPDLLLEALRSPLGLEASAQITWRSPREAENFREYRDMGALRQLGIHSLPKRTLAAFWPEGGPVHDALGKVSDGQLLFLEAKAHIGEIFTPGTRATQSSRKLIDKSLNEARHHFAPQSQVAWSNLGYQCANRLAFHYLIHVLNELPSHMVFLYFNGAREMSNAPGSEQEWKRPIRYLHQRLGLPDNFQAPGVHTVFFDVSLLTEFAEIPPAPEPTIWQPWHHKLIDSFKE